MYISVEVKFPELRDLNLKLLIKNKNQSQFIFGDSIFW